MLICVTRLSRFFIVFCFFGSWILFVFNYLRREMKPNTMPDIVPMSQFFLEVRIDFLTISTDSFHCYTRIAYMANSKIKLFCTAVSLSVFNFYSRLNKSKWKFLFTSSSSSPPLSLLARIQRDGNRRFYISCFFHINIYVTNYMAIRVPLSFGVWNKNKKYL